MDFILIGLNFGTNLPHAHPHIHTNVGLSCDFLLQCVLSAMCFLKTKF